MFVNTKTFVKLGRFITQPQRVKLVGLAGVFGLGLTSLANANSALPDYQLNDLDAAKIPVTVELTGLALGETPLYISIQKRDEYMQNRGYGGIIQTITASEMRAEFQVDVEGDYAISVWHDLDKDNVFSMDKSYRILDGWGASGNASPNKRPNFDDVKVRTEGENTHVPITLIYTS